MAINSLENLNPEDWENLTPEDWRNILGGLMQSSKDSIPEFERVELSKEQLIRIQRQVEEARKRLGIK